MQVHSAATLPHTFPDSLSFFQAVPAGLHICLMRWGCLHHAHLPARHCEIVALNTDFRLAASTPGSRQWLSGLHCLGDCPHARRHLEGLLTLMVDSYNAVTLAIARATTLC